MAKKFGVTLRDIGKTVAIACTSAGIDIADQIIFNAPYFEIGKLGKIGLMTAAAYLVKQFLTQGRDKAQKKEDPKNE